MKLPYACDYLLLCFFTVNFSPSLNAITTNESSSTNNKNNNSIEVCSDNGKFFKYILACSD